MDVPSTVFPKEVPHLPVFLRVLVVIKERDDLVACLFEMIHGDVEDEIVTADVSDKPSRSQTPHDIAQDLGQQPDDAVTVLVSIAIVEFLEVIEVRITHGELLTHTKTFFHVESDVVRARQACRRVDRHVTVRTLQDLLESQFSFPLGKRVLRDLVGSGLQERSADRVAEASPPTKTTSGIIPVKKSSFKILTRSTISAF